MTLKLSLVSLAWEGVMGATSYDILLDGKKVAQAGPRARTTKITIPEGSEHLVTIKAQPSGKLQEAMFEWARDVAPAPPDPPSSALTGVSYLRYGNGELPLSHTGDYDFVVTSWGGAQAAGASPARKVLHYMSAISCKTGAGGAYHFGVTSEDARANGWVLKDSGGAEMTNFQYGGSAVPLGNPGLAGYQQAWAQNVANRLLATGCDGVFMDDVLFWTTGISNGKTPQNYPTQLQWQEAVRQFMVYVGAYLKTRSLYLVCNATGWFPGSTDYAGDNDVSLWTALAPHVSGLCSETWVWHPAISSGIRKSGSGWDQNWDAWLRLPALCEQRGIDFHAICASTNPAHAIYTLCSLLLETNGTHYFTPGDYSSYDRSSIWLPVYDRLPLGAPLGPKLKSGNEWQRRFANGMVWVDPVAGTSGVS